MLVNRYSQSIKSIINSTLIIFSLSGSTIVPELVHAQTAQVQIPSSSTNILKDIAERGEFIIAARKDSIPFSFVESTPVPKGYSIDLCLAVYEAVKKELRLPKLKVSYVLVGPQSRFETLQRKEAHIECGSTTNNADRRKRFAFSFPHFIASVRVMVHNNRGIDRIEDMKNKKIAVPKGTTTFDHLQKLNEQMGLNFQLIEVEQHQEGWKMLVDGIVDGYASDDILLAGLRAQSKRNNDFRMIGSAMTIEPYGLMFNKGDAEYKRIVDDTLRIMMKSYVIHRLYKKWFETPIPPNKLNLELPMSFLLRDSFKFPTDNPGNL
jgi:ABC-type amino acid transport substrate-binding protein